MAVPMRRLGAAIALLLPIVAAQATLPQQTAEAGQSSEIVQEISSSENGSGGSTSSSFDRNVLAERVIGVRDGGIELEYDLPANATARDRAANWQFPVRVLKPTRGPLQLLNRDELEARVDPWLKKGGITRAACGHWIFTWNAFRIECDPQTVIGMLDPFDLRPSDLQDGAPYQDPGARTPAALMRNAAGVGGATFSAELAIDPEAVRKSRAEADVVTGEIMHKPLTLDAALKARAAEKISGMITVTFDVDAAGSVWRRTRVTRLEITEGRGVLKRTITETVRRRLLPVSGA